MNYNHYKKARDMAWKTLIECKINRLPVDLWQIAAHYNLKIHVYSKSAICQLLKEDILNGDGFIIYIGNEKHIFINDKINNKNRRRFTLAHELGHAILEHDIGVIHYRHSEHDNKTKLEEWQANIFARNILMPATVLAALNIHTPDEIMNMCAVSRHAAEVRAERMQELLSRNMFDTSPAEQKVHKLFCDFISNYKK